VSKALPSDPTTAVERKVQNIFSKHEATLRTGLKHILPPYHSKPPHLYGLPQIQKPDLPLESTVSCTGTPCYNLAKFPHQILYSTVGKTETWVESSQHFSQLLKSVKFQGLNVIGTLDFVKVFTKVPVEEILAEGSCTLEDTGPKKRPFYCSQHVPRQLREVE
jgi:hypothetical protein